MKKISIMIPCYNEEDNVRPICDAVRKILKEELSEYDYEILFIDNKSKDRTRKILRELCAEDTHVKAIFNMQNFGQFNSPYYGLCQTQWRLYDSIVRGFPRPRGTDSTNGT